MNVDFSILLQANDPELRKKNPFGRVGPVRAPARPFVAEEARGLGLLVSRVPGPDGQVWGGLQMVKWEGAACMQGQTAKDRGIRNKEHVCVLGWLHLCAIYLYSCAPLYVWSIEQS